MKRGAKLLDAYILHENDYTQPEAALEARQFFLLGLVHVTTHWDEQCLAELLCHSGRLHLAQNDGLVRSFLGDAHDAELESFDGEL